MSLIVNIKLLEDWLEQHSPFAVEKLSVKAEVATTVIAKTRRGVVPKSLTRKLLAQALGIKEDDLFKPAPTGENKAS